MLTTLTRSRLELRRDKAEALLNDALRSGADTEAELHLDAWRAYNDVLAADATQRRAPEPETSPYLPGSRRSFYADVAVSARLHSGRHSERLDLYKRTEARSTMSSFGGLVPPAYLAEEIRSSGHSLRPLCDYLAEQYAALDSDEDDDTAPAFGGAVIFSRITTGATAEDQASENTGVTFDNPDDTPTTVPLCTVFSGITVSKPALDRSTGGSFDRMVTVEVVGAVDAKQEARVIAGTGADGQPTGLLNLSGKGTVTLTSTSTGDLLDAVGKAAAASHQAAGRPPDSIALAPRRWQHVLAKSGDYGAAISATTGPGPVVGRILNLNVVASPSAPLTESTNEDRVVVFRRDDTYLGEEPEVVTANTDTYGSAGLLGVEIVVHRYYAFGHMAPAGVQVITGSGLANPYA